MTLTDEQIRDALSPLREIEVDPREVEALLAARARPRRRSWRPLAVAVPAALAAVAAVALLPAMRGDDARSASSLFRLAAASAADQPGAAFEGYRYTLVRDRFREPQIDASACRPPEPATPDAPPAEPCGVVRGHAEREAVREQWVDARWQGRRRTGGWRVIAADPPVEDAQLGGAADEPYEYGDGPLAQADLRELPTDPAQLEAALREAVRRSGARSDAMVDYELAHTLVHLIAEARIGPRLRGAAWAALARIEGARALGEQRDPLGRRGEAVELALTYGPPGQVRPTRHRLTVIFEPEDARILSWTERSDPGDPARATDQTHVVEATGDTRTTTDRP